MKKIALLLICIAMCCSIMACGPRNARDDLKDIGWNGSGDGPDKNVERAKELEVNQKKVWSAAPDIVKEAQSIVDNPKVIDSKVAFGQNSRRIYGIIIHSCGNPKTYQEAQELLRTVAWYGYSYHYIIIDGKIDQMVDEGKVAFHAGPSQFPNYPNKLHGVNEDTIGIALRTDMTEKDYKALVWLIKYIMLRDSNVKKELILNHKDVAPGRKTDHEKIDMAKFNKMIDWPKFEKQRTIYRFLCDVELCMKLGTWDQGKAILEQDAKDYGIYDEVKYIFETKGGADGVG